MEEKSDLKYDLPMQVFLEVYYYIMLYIYILYYILAFIIPLPQTRVSEILCIYRVICFYRPFHITEAPPTILFLTEESNKCIINYLVTKVMMIVQPGLSSVIHCSEEHMQKI